MRQMDAIDRIVEEFDRLVALGRDGVATRPLAERIVYYVVATRYEIDIDGFMSVYEQDLSPAELELLINGLQRIGEPELATEFRHGLESLDSEGFYGHMNWNKVSPTVKAEIDAIRERIGPRLWDLDEKLAALLDHDAAVRPAG
ncbi:MAG TPA: hypothetical protein VG269_15215 [Tepidisphaeraceae bacterium]|jgi:hypothetical protein|nr:hypothetical protein [Tepidisphaeraceae bacterium]